MEASNMKTNTIIKCLVAAAIPMMLLCGCTDEFEYWNTNKHEATVDQMEKDNLFTGALFRQIERNVIIISDGANTLDSDYQIAYNLNADIFSGYFAPTNGFSTNGNNSASYNMTPQWNGALFTYKYNGTMSAYTNLVEKALAAGQDEIVAIADVVKVASMQQVTDYYGPIPYSKVGQSINSEYDSQKDVYTKMLEELDSAIDALTTYYSGGNTRILSKYDLVYGGDVAKWIKFANSLRLRLAMRIVYADANLAKTEAEKSVAHSLGVMTAAGDMACLDHGALVYHHPIWEIAFNFNDGDTHMGASMDSFMNGYNDPRIGIYWNKAADGGYHGVRQGIHSSNWAPYGNKANNVSSPNFTKEGTLVTWMTASEVYFLRAEGALRGWNMGGSAQNLYTQGITMSFEETGAGSASSYISNSSARPANFTDKAGSNSANAVSTITIAWNTSDSFETSLEKIITQKWIAIFPNGCEAWAEQRRTGYPKLFPVVSNDSGGQVNSNTMIRRIPYPQGERDNNAEELDKGISLLGGPDSAGTKLWWDKK